MTLEKEVLRRKVHSFMPDSLEFDLFIREQFKKSGFKAENIWLNEVMKQALKFDEPIEVLERRRQRRQQTIKRVAEEQARDKAKTEPRKTPPETPPEVPQPLETTTDEGTARPRGRPHAPQRVRLSNKQQPILVLEA